MEFRGTEPIAGINEIRRTRVWGEESGKLHKELSQLIKYDLGSTESEVEELEKMDSIEKTPRKEQSPYSFLADSNGDIVYKGVRFHFNGEKKQMELGDMTNPSECINIPLSKGGKLVVNRQNIDQLGVAISMFSPEDIKLILNALRLDGKVREIEIESEDNKAGVGEKKETSGTKENPDSKETQGLGDAMKEEKSVPIGASSFTQKEWNKLMEKIDVMLEEMLDKIRRKEEERVKNAQMQGQLETSEEKKQAMETEVKEGSGEEATLDKETLELLFQQFQ